MKKTVYTLIVDGFAPKLTAITLPYLKGYAEKIGAEFYVISSRKHPQYPPVYEKIQIYDLGRNNDWNIYIDADALIHPDTPDPTVQMTKDTTAHYGNDFAPIRWREDNFFWRDGRHLGSGNWFTIASNWCLDLWHPLEDLSFDEAVENIFPTAKEKRNGINREHLIDDYLLSRNMARYGLKATTLRKLWEPLHIDPAGYLYHDYNLSVEEKVIKTDMKLKEWGLK